jgi:hypothetical protein
MSVGRQDLRVADLERGVLILLPTPRHCVGQASVKALKSASLDLAPRGLLL